VGIHRVPLDLHMVSWVFRLDSVTKNALLCRACWFNYFIVTETMPLRLKKTYDQMVDWAEKSMGANWANLIRAKYPQVAVARPKFQNVAEANENAAKIEKATSSKRT
jgi:hypothetical protein